MDCYVPPLEGRTQADLVNNRNALYWSLVACNLDKASLREYYQ